MQRVFAVEVKGQRPQQSAVREASAGLFSVSLAPSSVQAASLPLCVFLFAIDSEEGFYRWLHEPIVTPTGSAKLLLNHALVNSHNGHSAHQTTRVRFDRLDDAALEAIVAQVNGWYRAKESLLTTIG